MNATQESLLSGGRTRDGRRTRSLVLYLGGALIVLLATGGLALSLSAKAAWDSTSGLAALHQLEGFQLQAEDISKRFRVAFRDAINYIAGDCPVRAALRGAINWIVGDWPGHDLHPYEKVKHYWRGFLGIVLYLAPILWRGLKDLFNMPLKWILKPITKRLDVKPREEKDANRIRITNFSDMDDYVQSEHGWWKYAIEVLAFSDTEENKVYVRSCMRCKFGFCHLQQIILFVLLGFAYFPTLTWDVKICNVVMTVAEINYLIVVVVAYRCAPVGYLFNAECTGKRMQAVYAFAPADYFAIILERCDFDGPCWSVLYAIMNLPRHLLAFIAPILTIKYVDDLPFPLFLAWTVTSLPCLVSILALFGF